ncbi:hypothetical protein BC830DRAFT_1141699 [Chytriomyces sp. MP71]|nr:hypothetical protein BC830DRAFT_1141699 [Chytriomyces sp. MP71]
MRPAFPSLAWPNHYTLVTGLYPESHEIVGNLFHDDASDDLFDYMDFAGQRDARWWRGESMLAEHAQGPTEYEPKGTDSLPIHRPTVPGLIQMSNGPNVTLILSITKSNMYEQQRGSTLGEY